MKLIQKAIRFASKIHKDQKRKNKEKSPYISHPLGVGLLLSTVTKDENVICAGILHDTIEDGKNPKVTYEDIKKEFNKEIAEMVNDVTEQDKSLAWEVRKQQGLEHISIMPKNSLLVKTADVIQNLSDLLEDYKKEGESVWKYFNAPKEKQIAKYNNLYLALKSRWPENPLLNNLQKLIEIINKLSE